MGKCSLRFLFLAASRYNFIIAFLTTKLKSLDATRDSISQSKGVYKMARVTLSGLDYSLEGTSTSFNLVDLTAANFTAQGVILADGQTAIQGVSLIAYEGAMYPAMVTARENTRPASPFAQREHKWLVRFADNVTSKVESFEIGGADLTLLIPGTEKMDLTTPEGAALVAFVETNVRSNAGNPVTVTEVIHVGRAS